MFSAFYKSEEAGGYILRLWNSADSVRKTGILFAVDIQSITVVAMDEDREITSLKLSGNVRLS